MYIINQRLDDDDNYDDLIKIEENRIIPTYEGMMVLDQILLKLI